jgi:demethylmenaquinone methyltransferase/2-methoxy-6-polyprenyl-1,4-benzoquinol methylase
MVRHRRPRARAIAVDLTERMLRLARQRGIEETVCADATRLPFPDGRFDAVFIGYGLRNFPDLRQALREVQRVTRPGGLLVTLDFFLPGNPVLRKIYLAYLYVQGTFWGTILHRRPRTYTYIPDSLRHFVSIAQFEALLRKEGYSQVGGQSFILGGIGLHWAAKGN